MTDKPKRGVFADAKPPSPENVALQLAQHGRVHGPEEEPDRGGEFDPDWTVCPGVTMREAMTERDLTIEQLAEACSLPVATMQGLLTGEPMTVGMAAKLAAGVGGSESFWLERERLYREDLRLGRKDVS